MHALPGQTGRALENRRRLTPMHHCWKKKPALRRVFALAALLTLCLSAGSAYALAPSTLFYGSRGEEVLKLQAALISLGYNTGGADGKFGKGTEAAVKQFQASVGLTADGKAGILTLARLYSSGTVTDTPVTDGTTDTAIPSVTNPNTLKYGDVGDKVTALQTALQAAGYNPNGIDGRYGAGTRQAIIRFQKANGLTADGLAGTKTQNLLFSLVQSGVGGGTVTATPTPNSGASSGFTRTLRKGYTGSDVTAVQNQLKALGYYTNTVDGSYGAGTMAAVRQFQTNNGLTADGLTRSVTYARLFSSGAIAAGGSASSGDTATAAPTATPAPTTPPADSTSLRYGDKGSAVTKLQQALKALGYNVTSDGDYGALTQTAVSAFQKQNGLSSDGVAGADTLALLYSGSGKGPDPNANADMQLPDGTGQASGPATSQVQLLHWFNEVKPSLSNSSHLTVFDPATSLQWTLRVYARGRHCDSEPLTLTDTKIIFKAFGNTNTWTPKAVYVQLPSGAWTLATMHNVPHLTGSITDNGFDGHLCVHFLRDMDECQQNDPNYGVTNQKLIRSTWKNMTGITVE